jgi:BirA family biotin operon repressor/biotin-[acetyl-CoA-carboxylase] ligase
VKLDVKKIQEGVCGMTVHYLPVVDSTNEWAKRDPYLENISVYLADHQTKGKGSRGRGWESPDETSVSMSIRMKPEIPPERISMLTLVMGLAAAKGIREMTDLPVQIKWPNDLVCFGKKLCGILTEYVPESGQVIIGAGINLNNQRFPEELQDKATSLINELGCPVDREQITIAVLKQFKKQVACFLKTLDLSELRGAYEKLLINRGRMVRVMDLTAPFDGTALGITALGELLVQRGDTQEVEKVYAGEVSVRGIYGYV